MSTAAKRAEFFARFAQTITSIAHRATPEDVTAGDLYRLAVELRHLTAQAELLAAEVARDTPEDPEQRRVRDVLMAWGPGW